MIEYIERKRKQLIVVFIIIIAVIIVFMSTFNLRIDSLQRDLQTSLDLRREGLEMFRDEYKERSNSYIQALQTDWQAYKQRNEEDEISKNEFIDEHVSTIEYMADRFLVAVENNDNVIYKGYEYGEYGQVDVTELEKGKNRVLNGWDDTVPFGEGNRFYYSSMEINDGVYVHVGFLEQIAMQDYVETADAQLIQSMIDNTESVISYLIYFMLIIGFISLITLYLIFQLGRNFTLREIGSFYSLFLLSNFLNEDDEVKEFLEDKLEEIEGGYDCDTMVEQFTQYLKEKGEKFDE